MTSDPTRARTAFEARVRALEGARLQAVDYWDIHNFGPEPSVWDYGDWHHAVMGVQLSTDSGPFTVTWTNTFHPYGVEVFADPIECHLVLGSEGPQRIGPDGESRWSPLLGTPIRRAQVWWDLLQLGPATLSSGEVVEAARDVDLPTALRLHFDAGPVWFVAAIPQAPSMEDTFIPGDEIMVVFASAKLQSMGYDDPGFIDGKHAAAESKEEAE
ncbi:hypothetical protein [Mumia sp. Pv 4-285]|uniref:hypothetical protein n=1 Tax=Mumia qirimensis TaxID=3234852 RepID=UPI00351DA12C